MKLRAKIEFGDFQTPLPLAREVCALLVREGIKPSTVLEPTCGCGAFLVAAAEAFPVARLQGWDINGNYVQEARSALARAGGLNRARLGSQDFFTHDWDAEFTSNQSGILVLGNLPWVTNAAVSGINGSNLPIKQNFLRLRGIEARTGKSNFDISEWMLIRLLKALHGREAVIAMLCKTATARKLLHFAWQNDGRISEAALYLIAAKKHFGASVDACLLLARLGDAGGAEADVFNGLDGTAPVSTLGLAGKGLVSDIKLYRNLRHLEGFCPYQWRSGVKHDCASVMELSWDKESATLRNKLGAVVHIESGHIFPLLKCSDLANGRVETDRFVIVTQRRVGEDTRVIATKAPRTWRYLNAHLNLFQARKSSIYRNDIPFAMFGIGDYSFAPWKVAVSGLHRRPRFILVGPVEGKPVLFDDTCYFLPFGDRREARLVARILNTPECLEFFTCLAFPDSKRPITVGLLRRLNIGVLAEEVGLAEEWATARKRGIRYSEQPVSVQAEFVMDRPAE